MDVFLSSKLQSFKISGKSQCTFCSFSDC